MPRYDFSGGKDKAKATLTQFLTDARAFKPPNYDIDARQRLNYYTDQQEQDVRDHLKKTYPQTAAEVTPWCLPITGNIVNEQARVFLAQTRFDLVDKDGKEIDTDAPPAKAWQAIRDENQIGFLLKQVDRYTGLFNTCALRPAWDEDAEVVRYTIFFPHLFNVVLDPAYPTNPDKAFGVLFEVGSDAGPYIQDPEKKRYEFWCARKGEEQYRVLRGDGTVETKDKDSKNPFKDEKGRAFVPVIFFLLHGPELGLFTLANAGLVTFNRAVNLLESDVHHIAKFQGFGHTWFTNKDGAGKMPSTIELSPARANPLPSGIDVKVTNGNPILGELDTLKGNDIKRGAVLRHIPPGAVAQDAKSAPSGYALQIERQPLIEHRTDRVEIFRMPMKRLWTVTKGVHNTYAGKKLQFPAGTDMNWTPGEIEVPVDPKEQQDLDLIDLANDLTTSVAIIMRKYGLSKKAAEEKFKEMRDENAKTHADQLATAEVQAGAIAGRGAMAAFRAEQARRKLAAGTPGQQAGVTPPPGQQPAAGQPGGNP